MSRRRFIAGAECPYCQQMDRMVVDVSADGLVTGRLCLACGKAEEMSAGDAPETNQQPVQAFPPVRLLD